MNSTPDRPPPLTPGQRDALLTLLQDEDPGIAEAVERRILAEGPGLTDWLRPHVLSDDPVLRRRARQILNRFEAEAADSRMLEFCVRGDQDLDLEEGALRLAQTQYPEINLDAYRAVLDEWAARVGDWLPADRSDDDATLAAIQVGLFQQVGLRGNESNYYEPENSFLNRTMDRRMGNPIGLCTVMLLIGRRLGLPLAGIGLPAHFLCRYQSPTRQIYIDAFHGGRLLSRTDCIAFVNQLGRPFEDAYLQPVGARRMLQRVCVNLEHAFETLERHAELGRIRRYHQRLGGG
jgi:regulator of sirC expression with transglutaminase-like and TPR domain